jgi:hypothetical protein
MERQRFSSGAVFKVEAEAMMGVHCCIADPSSIEPNCYGNRLTSDHDNDLGHEPWTAGC